MINFFVRECNADVNCELLVVLGLACYPKSDIKYMIAGKGSQLVTVFARA